MSSDTISSLNEDQIKHIFEIFRVSEYVVGTKEELLQNFDFNEAEFEDSINMQLVKCQSYEEAEQFHQLKFWFDVL